MASTDPQARLQTLSDEFQKLQQGKLQVLSQLVVAFTDETADIQSTIASRQKLEGQKQENVGVQLVRFSSLIPSTRHIRLQNPWSGAEVM